jgi:hypothetical protein
VTTKELSSFYIHSDMPALQRRSSANKMRPPTSLKADIQPTNARDRLSAPSSRINRTENEATTTQTPEDSAAHDPRRYVIHSNEQSDRSPRVRGLGWIGKGMRNDIRARAPWYFSDWTDAWNYRVIPATWVSASLASPPAHCSTASNVILIVCV